MFALLTEVSIISQLSGKAASQRLAPELNRSQFVVLNHFARLGGEQSVQSLARAMQVTKGAMSNTVARLQHKGYVRVRPHPTDGRSRLVALTETGLQARQQAVQGLSARYAGLGGLMESEELERALATLRKLRVWLDTHR